MQRGRRRISVMKERQKGREKKKRLKMRKRDYSPSKNNSREEYSLICVTVHRNRKIMCYLYTSILRRVSTLPIYHRLWTTHDRYLEKPKSVISPHVEAETRRLSLEYIYIFASWMSNRSENTFRKLCGKEKKKKEKYMRYRSTEKSHTCKLSERKKKNRRAHAHGCTYQSFSRGKKKERNENEKERKKRKKLLIFFFF